MKNQPNIRRRYLDHFHIEVEERKPAEVVLGELFERLAARIEGLPEHRIVISIGYESEEPRGERVDRRSADVEEDSEG